MELISIQEQLMEVDILRMYLFLQNYMRADQTRYCLQPLQLLHGRKVFSIVLQLLACSWKTKMRQHLDRIGKELLCMIN